MPEKKTGLIMLLMNHGNPRCIMVSHYSHLKSTNVKTGYYKRNVSD